MSFHGACSWWDMSSTIRWGWHVALLGLTALPVMAYGVWLIATAGGSLPQVALLLGAVAIAIGLVDLLVTTLMASRLGTSVPRLLVIHSVGLVSVVGLAFAVLPHLR